MPIPTQTEMFSVVLEIMADGKERTRNELKGLTLEKLRLTEQEAATKTSSGVPVYGARVGWSVSYLSRAKLITRVRRGVYVISKDGRAALSEGMDAHAFWVYLQKRIDEFDPWNRKDQASTEEGTGACGEEAQEIPDSAESSPQEQIESLAEEMNETLAEEVIALIMDRDSSFFERVVVDLLEKMGYGKGEVTKRTGDGGIDGLITTDVLGFRPICTQAKRYAADHKIGRPTIQEFVGALNGAPNGVFITTSSFTKEALDYAKGYPGATLSLIDGKRLAELMIEYNLGVSTESVVEIKRIDTDYFEEQ